MSQTDTMTISEPGTGVGTKETLFNCCIYLVKKTGYGPEYYTVVSSYNENKEKLSKACETYNKAFGDAADESERGALKFERAKAEKFVTSDSKDYKGMVGAVSDWGPLFGEIHKFYTKRAAIGNRARGPHDQAEKEYDELAEKVSVPHGSGKDTFTQQASLLDDLGIQHEKNQSEATRDQLLKIPEPYKELAYFQTLQKNAGSRTSETKMTARKDIATWDKALIGATAALLAVEKYTTKKTAIAVDLAAAAIFKDMPASLPSKITAVTGAPTEEKYIQTATDLEPFIEDAADYAAIKKKVDDAWIKQNKPKMFEQQYKTATEAPAKGEDFKTRTLLLTAVDNDLEKIAQARAKASQFDTKYGNLNDEFGKLNKIEPQASSDPGTLFAKNFKLGMENAKKLAAKGEHDDGLLELSKLDQALTKRKGEAKDATDDRLVEAKGVEEQLTNAKGSLNDAVYNNLLSLIAPKGTTIALPDTAEVDKLGANNEAMNPFFLVDKLLKPAQTYCALLTEVQNNWKPNGAKFAGFADEYRKAIVLPRFPPMPPETFYDAPTNALKRFNDVWKLAKAFWMDANQARTDLEVLEDNLKGIGRGGRNSPVPGIRGALNNIQKLAGQFNPATINQQHEALRKILVQIEEVQQENIEPLKNQAVTSTTGAGPKAMVDRLAVSTDKRGANAAATLYVALGKNLQPFLESFAGFAGDTDHGKASEYLANICEQLGPKALQRVTNELFEGDAKAAGRMMRGLVETGLKGNSTDIDDKRTDNLEALAEAFKDEKELFGLLSGFAKGGSDNAGKRMDVVLTKYFGKDVKKLKTPFFDELVKAPSDLTVMIARAATFEHEAMPDEGSRAIDPSLVKGLRCDSERVQHFLNRHTRKHCGFTAENVGPNAKNQASFWPEETTMDKVKEYLEKAMTAIGTPPNRGDLPGLPPAGQATFGQQHVWIATDAGNVEVCVGFAPDELDMGKVKITQFYPSDGDSIDTIRKSDLQAIGKALALN